ncbi:hypothetical protein A6J76_009485 [Aggregatibacter aphrophilus]|nr:hypothetical protein A6J76_009485 [Aggregatibacter aphrophilus]RDF02227.1 hypothetical protein DPV99_05785 [Aggregatibacter aphrophilus]
MVWFEVKVRLFFEIFSLYKAFLSPFTRRTTKSRGEFCPLPPFGHLPPQAGEGKKINSPKNDRTFVIRKTDI